MSKNGWIGRRSQLVYALSIAGADEKEGGFVVYGDIFISPWPDDDPDIIVDEKANFFIKGQACSIAGLMVTTSYGTNVTVISAG